jgi:small subunit ribosomal protein S14
LKKKTDSKKNPKADNKNQQCNVCHTNRGLIHKYGLHICRRCFREVASSIGFRKLS